MKTLRRTWKKLAGALQRGARDADLDAELASHIEMLTDENLRRGMSPEEARRAALVTFGGVDRTKEGHRDQRGIAWLDALRQDIRQALRGMRASPAFTAVVIGCLALGIGANTAIFTLFNAVMLRSLPVNHPKQLVLLQYELKKDTEVFRKTGSGYSDIELPYQAFLAMRNGTRSLSGAFAYVPVGFSNQGLNVNASGHASVAGGAMVSGNCFTVLGVEPILGRAITDDDLAPGTPNVAVISYRFWSRQFGRNPSIVGRAITLNNAPFTVIGVAPPGFFGVDPALTPDIWVPLRDIPEIRPWGGRGLDHFHNRFYWWCTILGRLKPGATIEQARSELDVIFQQTIMQDVDRLPPPEQIPHITLTPIGRGLENLRLRLSEPLHVLLIAVALVLVIACANLAILLLARASARTRETGIRVAIGASRSRLVRQFLTESVLLSLFGGGLGLLLAQWGSKALLVMDNPSGSMWLSLEPDATVLGFTAGICVLTGIIFGLAPALRATGRGVAGTLKQQSSAASRKTFLGKALVALQVALSVCLLFGAGLLVRTLQKLEGQDFGFQGDHVLLFQLDPLRSGYRGSRVQQLYDDALHKIGALPGVRYATASENALLSGWVDNGPAATDGPALPKGQSRFIHWNVVGPDFLETMRIPLLLGHGIGWREMTGRRAAVINQSMARRFFPGQSPLGHHFSFGSRYNPAKDFEIVGVVKDAKYDRLRRDPPPTAYVPYSSEGDTLAGMFFEVRTAGDPLAMTAAVREAMRSIDPNLPMIGVKTQEQETEESLSLERMFATVSSFFGVLALLLVVVGLYGTLAYAVARRTGEIGIRMALGARRRQVLWMVLRESLAVVACGLAVGLPAALALSRYIESVLYGITGYDAATIAATALILAAAGALAGILPANRAARIDPMQALRTS